MSEFRLAVSFVQCVLFVQPVLQERVVTLRLVHLLLQRGERCAVGHGHRQLPTQLIQNILVVARERRSILAIQRLGVVAVG